jgi:peptide deformylase
MLRNKTQPVTFPLSDEDLSLVQRMMDYIDASYDGTLTEGLTPGIGIAAPQVGLDKSVIYIRFNDENSKEQRFLLANPKIVSFSTSFSYLEDGEGCLSVPEKHNGLVKRRFKIIVDAIDMLNGNKQKKITAEGYTAIALQHEIDHLNGILYYDHISKENPYYAHES